MIYVKKEPVFRTRKTPKLQKDFVHLGSLVMAMSQTRKKMDFCSRGRKGSPGRAEFILYRVTTRRKASTGHKRAITELGRNTLAQHGKALDKARSVGIHHFIGSGNADRRDYLTGNIADGNGDAAALQRQLLVLERDALRLYHVQLLKQLLFY